MAGLRERKKEHTRRALVEAAYRLFERDGYEQTTVASVAEAADVSVATFFNYFPSKEDLLFPDGDDILAAALGVVADRSRDDDPVDVLTTAVHAMITATRGGTRDPASALETRRLRLVMSVPALRAAMLQRAFTTLQRLADALCAAYPEDLDELTATTMVGAVFGAALAAGSVSIRGGGSSDQALTGSVDVVTRALRTLRGGST